MELKQGDLENIILNALWQMEEEDVDKIDVKDVQGKIKTETQGWAYTTVKTVLDRLVDKDIVLRIKEGKKYIYKTIVTRQQAGEDAIMKTAKQFFRSNFADMSSCVEKLKSFDFSRKEVNKVNN